MSAAAEGRLAALADADLPVVELADVFPHLRRPFAPAAVRWKVQTEWSTGAVVIAYIDARLVIERLNRVCPTMWETRFEPAPGGAMRCHLTLAGLDILGNARAITRSDVGVGQGRSDGDKLKAANSDAVKRAGVHFGIGVSIYAMKAVRLKVGAGDGELRTMEKEKKFGNEKRKVQVPIIDRATEEWLAATYERWLGAKGELLFGPALDHGDEAGAAGVDERPADVVADGQDREAEAPDEEPAGDVPVVLADDRAQELRLAAEGWYARLRKVAPRKLPPRAFREQLDGASGTHEALEAFVAVLEGLVAENEAPA